MIACMADGQPADSQATLWNTIPTIRDTDVHSLAIADRALRQEFFDTLGEDYRHPRRNLQSDYRFSAHTQ